MKSDVTMLFLAEMWKHKSKVAKRILRWFARHKGNTITLQCGVFWFDPMPDTDLIPAYVKQSVVSFMNRRYHAEIIEDWLPPAA